MWNCRRVAEVASAGRKKKVAKAKAVQSESPTRTGAEARSGTKKRKGIQKRRLVATDQKKANAAYNRIMLEGGF
jgi:hypothetical protein